MAQFNPLQIQQFLSGINFPASKGEVVGRAEANGADQGILDKLQQAPGDTFNSAKDVMSRFGK